MARKNAVQHGTPQGYKKHLKFPDWAGEPCDACKAAHAAELEDYRSRKGRDRATENYRAGAKRRALKRLGDEYPERLAELFDEELNYGGKELL